MNKNQDRRDELLAFYLTRDYCGGVRYYEGLPVSVLEQLIAEGFVDLDESQNDSPTIGEFLAFAKEAPADKIFFTGYVVHKDRSDYRLSIDGVISPTGENESAQFKARWEAFGKRADEKSPKQLWWD